MSTLMSVLTGKHWHYEPLSARAVERILQFDRERGFGPGGMLANRNRFYLYLTQSGSDVQIRTVAVKAVKRTEKPVVKEVSRASVDDPWMHVRALGFYSMGGYVVAWERTGFSGDQRNYISKWYDEAYAMRCMWKVWAPVINPELLKRTRRFRWSAWEPARGHLLDYLKVYKEHPEIELLSKCGLGKFCTKLSIVRKLKADKKFRQFFMQNAEKIQQCGVDVIMKAYCKGISIGDAFNEIAVRREFRGLPRSICAVKAGKYIKTQGTHHGVYMDYLHNCQKLGMEINDTKVSFPKRFKERRQVVQDQVDAIRRQEKAEEIAKMNRQLAAIAEAWGKLERKGRDYQIVMPRTEQAFVDAGKAMANCLGQYAGRVARGELVVVFVRRSSQPRKAFVAAAYDPKQELITQCYGVKNSKPPKPVSDFVKRVFAGEASKKQLKEAA